MSRNNWWGLVASVVTVLVALGLLRLLGDDPPDLPDRVGGLVAAAPAARLPTDDDYSTRSYAALDAGRDDLRGATVLVARKIAGTFPPGFLVGAGVQRVEQDDVECLVTPSASRRKKASTATFVCQRTGSGLTVQVRAVGMDVVDAVDFVNAVWDEVD